MEMFIQFNRKTRNNKTTNVKLKIREVIRNFEFWCCVGTFVFSRLNSYETENIPIGVVE